MRGVCASAGRRLGVAVNGWWIGPLIFSIVIPVAVVLAQDGAPLWAYAVTAVVAAAIVFAPIAVWFWLCGKAYKLLRESFSLRVNGKYEEAITTARRARTIFRVIFDDGGQGRAWLDLGVALLDAGRPGEACYALDRACMLLRRPADYEMRQQALYYLSIAS